MLKLLLSAGNEQQRDMPYIRYASQVAESEPSQAAGSSPDPSLQQQQPSSPSNSAKADSAMALRLVQRPGSEPLRKPGAPTRATEIPTGTSSPHAAPSPSSKGSPNKASSDLGGAVVPQQQQPATGSDLTDSIDKAYTLTARANKLIAGGLHNCPDWQEVRELYFAAAAHFQTAGYHSEAGEAFSNAAAIARVYESDLEVATAATYAVDSFKLVDVQKALQLLDEIMAIHHAGQRPKLEARAARDMAELYESIGELEPALEHYRRALALFEKQEITRNFYLKCLEKVAVICAILSQYRDAMAAFEKLADAATRGTRVTDRYLRAMLCLLADARGERQAAVLAKAKTVFDRYQDRDEFFQKGVEHRLVRGIIEAFDKASLALFDETQKAFFEYRAKDGWYNEMLARCRHNLFEYLAPYM